MQHLLQQPPFYQLAGGQCRLCAGAGQGLCVWRVPGAAGWRAGEGCGVSGTPDGSEVRLFVCNSGAAFAVWQPMTEPLHLIVVH
jgi:hypothetical protein